MIALIIKALSNSLLQALFGFIQTEMRNRQLIEQGRLRQRAADLEATVQGAKDAAQIQEAVARDSDADLDAGLERVRNSAVTSNR